jgi:hypothetical protein
MNPPPQPGTSAHASQLQHQLQQQHKHYNSAAQLSAPTHRVRFFDLPHIITSSDPSLRVEIVPQATRPILKNCIKIDADSPVSFSPSLQSIAAESEQSAESAQSYGSLATDPSQHVQHTDKQTEMHNPAVEAIADQPLTVVVPDEEQSICQTSSETSAVVLGGDEPKAVQSSLEPVVSHTSMRRYSSLSVILPGNQASAVSFEKAENISPRKMETVRQKQESSLVSSSAQRTVSYAAGVQPPTPTASSQALPVYLTANTGRIRSVSSSVRGSELHSSFSGLGKGSLHYNI